MPKILAARLREHRMRSGRRFGLVFSADGSRPLDPRGIGRRAATAWKNANPNPLEPIGLRLVFAWFSRVSAPSIWSRPCVGPVSLESQVGGDRCARRATA
jgi:hypothetical protein